MSECQPCHKSGRKGYCALGRCYCGHEGCPAFDSWCELPPPIEATTKTTRHNTSWDDRDEATWIDKL